MIEESLLISDTNIFIDLISINLLERFFHLPCNIETTDFVIAEIEQPSQLLHLENLIKLKKLKVISFSFEQVTEN